LITSSLAIPESQMQSDIIEIKNLIDIFNLNNEISMYKCSFLSFCVSET
jgi:hypothetical protein